MTDGQGHHNTLSRVGSTISNTDKEIPVLLLDHNFSIGGAGVVYWSPTAAVILKFSYVGTAHLIWNEGQIYCRLMKEGIRFVPNFYGLFEWPGGYAIILSDEGKGTLQSWDELNRRQRYTY